jgi:glycosyltransferase involved in cell wall biosynthesis
MSQSSCKKVLVVAYFFPPIGGGGVQRTVKFVKYLRDFGYEPTVLTVKKGKHSVDDTSFDKDIPKDVRIVRTNFIGLFAPKKKTSVGPSTSNGGSTKKSFVKKTLASVYHFCERFFFIPDIQMLWRPFAVGKALSVLRKEKFDVIYSTSSPFTNHLIARDLHRITGIPWVADFRDHWTLAPGYQPPSFVHRWLDRHFEESILHEASGIIFNTETNRREVQESFRFTPSKTDVIYNGFDSVDFGNFSFKKESGIHGYYIGSLYGKDYSAREIIAALNIALREREDIDLTFIGDIDTFSREIIMSSSLFNKKIFLKGYVPHSEITQFTLQAGFLVLTLPNLPRVECWVPQKMYEYVGSGRPIFALAPENGEVAQILKEVNAGVAISAAKTPEKVAEAFLGFIEMQEKNNFSSTTNKEASKKFERRNQTKQLADFLNEVAHEA